MSQRVFFAQMTSCPVCYDVIYHPQLSNDDGNGSENVTQKKNSRCFKFHRISFVKCWRYSQESEF